MSTDQERHDQELSDQEWRTAQARAVAPRNMVWRTDQNSATMLLQWGQPEEIQS